MMPARFRAARHNTIMVIARRRLPRLQYVQAERDASAFNDYYENYDDLFSIVIREASFSYIILDATRAGKASRSARDISSLFSPSYHKLFLQYGAGTISSTLRLSTSPFQR